MINNEILEARQVMVDFLANSPECFMSQKQMSALEAILTSLERAQKDSDRLDFLIKRDVYIHASEHLYYVLHRRRNSKSIAVLGVGRTRREAIDNAMKGEK